MMDTHCRMGLKYTDNTIQFAQLSLFITFLCTFRCTQDLYVALQSNPSAIDMHCLTVLTINCKIILEKRTFGCRILGVLLYPSSRSVSLGPALIWCISMLDPFH